MRRAATILVAPVVAAVCWASPAAAAPVDTASAHAGLRAYMAYASSTAAKVGTAGKSDDAFIAAIAAQCPGVLTPLNSAPPSSYDLGVLTAFGKEVGGDLVVSSFVPYRPVLATLTHRVSRLHWSRAATGRRIHTSLEAQRAVFELAPSDLCADATALAASAKVAPPGTSAFNASFERHARAAGLAALTRTLTRYRPPGDRKLARSVRRRLLRAETKLENVVGDKSTKLLGVLGLKI